MKIIQDYLETIHEKTTQRTYNYILSDFVSFCQGDIANETLIIDFVSSKNKRSTQCCNIAPIIGMLRLYNQRDLNKVDIDLLQQKINAILSPKPEQNYQINMALVEKFIAYIKDVSLVDYEFTRDKLSAKRDLVAFLLMADSGLRISEVCGLRTIAMIDGVVELIGKGKIEAILPLSTRTIQAIEDYLQLRGVNYLLNYPLVARHDKRVGDNAFEGTQGLSPRALQLRLDELLNNFSSTLADDTLSISPMSFRHYFVTRLSSHSLEVSQQLARHKEIATTMIYAHHEKPSRNDVFRTYSVVINKLTA